MEEVIRAVELLGLVLDRVYEHGNLDVVRDEAVMAAFTQAGQEE